MQLLPTNLWVPPAVRDAFILARLDPEFMQLKQDAKWSLYSLFRQRYGVSHTALSLLSKILHSLNQSSLNPVKVTGPATIK